MSMQLSDTGEYDLERMCYLIKISETHTCKWLEVY